MSTDTSIDLFAQRARCDDYLRGMVTVVYRLYKPLGPRAYAAEVELSYSGQYPLDFASEVSWPPSEDYDAAVRRGILAALSERGERSIGGLFTLVRVVVDPVHSCEQAFFLAGREAAASILRLLRSHAQT